MSHVSRAELRAFVATGAATAAFETHVDACPVCAERLGTLSAEQLAPVRGWPTVRLEFVVAVAVLALAIVWPKPSATTSAPTESSFALSTDLPAGVPDAGLFIKPLPLVVASLDAGGAR